MWSRVFALIYRAFYYTGLIFEIELMAKFLKTWHWNAEDKVFPTTEHLPYRKIMDYAESHGIMVTLGDLSHPNAVEIRAVEPAFKEQYEALVARGLVLAETLGKVLEQNGKLVEMDLKAIQDFSQFLQCLSQPKSPSHADRSMVV